MLTVSEQGTPECAACGKLVRPDQKMVRETEKGTERVGRFRTRYWSRVVYYHEECTGTGEGEGR